jgi:phosphomannomutase
MSTSWKRADHIVLFDVDGTLTESRQLILPEMEKLLLNDLKNKVTVGLVSGSDLKKLAEQMGGDDVIHKFDYVFPENGLVAYKKGKLIDKMDISKHMGEEKLQTFINFCLRYMAGI